MVIIFPTTLGETQKQYCSMNGRSKFEGKKVDFAVVLLDIIRRGPLSKKVSLHTPEMTTIKTSLKKIHNRENHV